MFLKKIAVFIFAATHAAFAQSAPQTGVRESAPSKTGGGAVQGASPKQGAPPMRGSAPITRGGAIQGAQPVRKGGVASSPQETELRKLFPPDKITSVNGFIASRENPKAGNCADRNKSEIKDPLWINDRYNFQAVTLVGDHMYVPLCIKNGSADINASTILNVMRDLKDDGSNENFDLAIEFIDQDRPGAYLYGMFVRRVPKRK